MGCGNSTPVIWITTNHILFKKTPNHRFKKIKDQRTGEYVVYDYTLEFEGGQEKFLHYVKGNAVINGKSKKGVFWRSIKFHPQKC